MSFKPSSASRRTDSPVAVRFDHVRKEYPLYRNDALRILSILPGLHNRFVIETKVANDDLSFTINRGESVALLGANGAGKSTALRIIAGITYPTSGTVEVNGLVSPLLGLTAGFSPLLSGRDNIYLRGTAMGLSREQIAQIEPRVVEFAELGVYIDQPLRTYSSGMQSRLGFALAAFVEHDILIIDEALAAGDAKFRAKSQDRINQIVTQENVTVLFVTHSSSLAKETCTRGLVLEQGRLSFDGPLDDAVAFYEHK